MKYKIQIKNTTQARYKTIEFKDSLFNAVTSYTIHKKKYSNIRIVNKFNHSIMKSNINNPIIPFVKRDTSECSECSDYCEDCGNEYYHCGNCDSKWCDTDGCETEFCEC